MRRAISQIGGGEEDIGSRKLYRERGTTHIDIESEPGMP